MHYSYTMADEEEGMENTKYGRQRERRWTPTRAKALLDARDSPNSLEINSPSEEEMGHWTPTGDEPMDDDDDDDDDEYNAIYTTCTQKFLLDQLCINLVNTPKHGKTQCFNHDIHILL